MVNLIKICGIQDIVMAKSAIAAGANLIGLVFHAQSIRDVHLNKAIEIAKAVKKHGAFPVAVFVNQTHHEMHAICQATDIQIVQLHGEIARQQHHLLPVDYQRIYVLNISEQGEWLHEQGMHSLDAKRDMILLDHAEPGEGKMIPRKDFKVPWPFPWLLAGGLTSENVAAIIDELKPDGVDVSSGVESEKGQKNIFLIREFIHAARGNYAPKKTKKN